LEAQVGTRHEFVAPEFPADDPDVAERRGATARVAHARAARATVPPPALIAAGERGARTRLREKEDEGHDINEDPTARGIEVAVRGPFAAGSAGIGCRKELQ